uniref:Histone-lysine N-methyltransferase SETMAR n=1 Tax=Heterorhabditis bacteriophora TaxID=37862 RepID=A0A1I7XAJ9_HETBA
MREIRNFIRDAYSINNELTAPALCKKIENELEYEVKLIMLKKLCRKLGFVCKSTKYGHLICSANKEKLLQPCSRMLEIEESFVDCVFSDESIMQLDSNSKICFVQKDDAIGRRRSVAKYPLKVHVWAESDGFNAVLRNNQRVLLAIRASCLPGPMSFGPRQRSQT